MQSSTMDKDQQNPDLNFLHYPNTTETVNDVQLEQEPETLVELNDIKEEIYNSSTSLIYPSSTSLVPSRREFSGAFNFQVKLSEGNSVKSSWLYSKIFDMVLIDMGKTLMVQFYVESSQPGLLIRALPVYSNPPDIHEPVHRCILHFSQDDPDGKAHQQDGVCHCVTNKLAGHIVRVYTLQANYCYDEFSKRHSVLVPLTQPQPGSKFIEVPYVFKCKTSCPGGMERRQIQLIFTLEDKDQNIFGRRYISLKICSSPKRDLERMERNTQQNCNSLTVNSLSGSNGNVNREVVKAKARKLYTEIMQNMECIGNKIEKLDKLQHLLSDD